jgi:single-stranded-DNA-specific exonuclease
MVATQLDGVDLRAHLDIDAEVTLPQLTGDTFQMIQKLAPFGRGNPMPIFLSRRVEVADCRTMGNNGAHLRWKLKQGNVIWDGVGFRLGNNTARTCSAIDIVYNLELDRWGGRERLRLNILDFAPIR